MPKKRISDDPKKERSLTGREARSLAGRVLSQAQHERRPGANTVIAGTVKSRKRRPPGAGVATAAGAVTVPGKALPGEATLSAVGALSVDEAKVLQDIVRERVRLPEDVGWGEFRFEEDSTGEPAVRIVLLTHDELKPSKIKIASLLRVKEEVRSIVHSQTNRWPYIEIATQ
jgi:hypothetical protein